MPDILLPSYKFDRSHFGFPQLPGNHFRKIIFQCQFKAFPNGNIEMEIIAYPASKRGAVPRDPWQIGPKVTGIKLDDGALTITHDPNDPLALGNNESPVWLQHPTHEGVKQEKLFEQLNNIFSEKSPYKEITFDVKTNIYKKNLHVYYDVSFSDGTTTLTNPCPPNQPGEPT